MSLTVDSNIYLPIGTEYDPVLVMALLQGATILIDSVTEIANGTITNDHIAASTIVASEKLYAESIEAGQIAANAITATRINANAVTADKIAADSITSVKISTGAVTSDKIYAGAVIATKLDISELSSISANLGTITSGSITSSLFQTNESPAVSRVLINSAGLRGYDSTLGLTFRLPTDGSAPMFASGQIQSVTIIESTITSSDFKTSTELPWIDITDSGVAYRYNAGGALYGTGVYGTATYGGGTSAVLFDSSKPILYCGRETIYGDIHFYNRSGVPSGASEVGDMCVVSSVPQFCTTAATPGTYKAFALSGNTQNVTFGTIGGTTITGTTITDGAFSVSSGAITGATTIVSSGLFTLNGGQIKFPATQSQSNDVNTLDDYEEGTWTPVIGGDASYTTQTGTYTKIGRLVFIFCKLQINVIGTGSTTAITGIPFNGTNRRDALSVSYFANSAASTIVLTPNVNSTNITFTGLAASATGVTDNVAIFGNGTLVQFSGCYETAT